MLAYLRAVERGHNIKCLIYMTAGRRHPEFFHNRCYRGLIQAQAASLELPLYVHEMKLVGSRESEGIKGLSGALKRWRFKGVVMGAVYVNEAAEYERALRKTGLTSICPLAGASDEAILKELSRHRIKAVVTAVNNKHRLKKWLGRIFRRDLINYINKEGDLTRDDFQTIVLNGLCFGRGIRITGTLSPSLSRDRSQTFLTVKEWKTFPNRALKRQRLPPRRSRSI